MLDEEERGRRRKEGRGGRRDEEEGGTRRKERRGGRSDEEEGATRRVKKGKSFLKNEKTKCGSRTHR